MTASFDSWLLLIVSLPTASAAARMRIWRAIKALGCAALRDGALHEEGQAWLLHVRAEDAEEDGAYRVLCDRTPDYTDWLAEWSEARKTLPNLATAERNRLRRHYARLGAPEWPE